MCRHFTHTICWIDMLNGSIFGRIMAFATQHFNVRVISNQLVVMSSLFGVIINSRYNGSWCIDLYYGYIYRCIYSTFVAPSFHRLVLLAARTCNQHNTEV